MENVHPLAPILRAYTMNAVAKETAALPDTIRKALLRLKREGKPLVWRGFAFYRADRDWLGVRVEQAARFELIDTKT